MDAEITSTAWFIDRAAGKERRRRFKATGEHKADSKRSTVAFWTAEAYVRTDHGRTRFQARGKTKDEAIERLAQRMSPSTGDRLAERWRFVLSPVSPAMCLGERQLFAASRR